jgi:hypothetical protein
MPPAYRYLRGYVIDPGFSTRLDTSTVNVGTYRIPYETVAPGPVGEYVEVMDVDPASNCWYEPVQLCDDEVASQNGLSPSEGTPQFHQQFVYAVSMKTINHFERALGRKVIWAPRHVERTRKVGRRRERMLVQEYVGGLRIYPHAIREANAFYDPGRVAVAFGYFVAANQSQGTNYPGGLVFTCLSPDIVAHEVTHAILDSIYPRYMEDSNPDVGGFHEGFADVVALLQRFTFRELVEHQLAATSGRLDRFTVLGELATQFGEALEGNRGALRSLIGQRNDSGEWVTRKPSPSDYIGTLEAHDRGAVLVATIFDAFQRLYAFRTEDLRRIASGGTGILPEGRVSTDLVRRFASEAAEIAQHLLHVCIRALDYCPPFDITYGDYLRALITADRDIAPEDESGYRLALIEAFRARGIFPDRVPTFSEESLAWQPPLLSASEQKAFSWLTTELGDDARALALEQDRRTLFNVSTEARERLRNRILDGLKQSESQSWEALLNKLGLSSRPLDGVFKALERPYRIKREQRSGRPDIEVHTLRPAFRAGREGRQVEQLLVTLTQHVDAEVEVDGDWREMTFRGGCTLILRLGAEPQLEYAVIKSIKSTRRLRAQFDYSIGATGERPPSFSMYTDGRRTPTLDLNLLHSTEAL